MPTILEREGAISTSLYSYNLYRNIKLSIGEFVVQRPLHWIENGREYSPLGLFVAFPAQDTPSLWQYLFPFRSINL